jgi:hypothetical protein
VDIRCYDSGARWDELYGGIMTKGTRQSNHAIEVTVEGIHAEAWKWHGLSDRMEGVFYRLLNTRVQALTLIEPLDTIPLYQIEEQYSKSANEYTGLLNGAFNEFDALAGALNKCADIYEETDGKSAKSFDEIASS